MAAAAPVSKPVEQPAAPAYNVQDDFHGRVEKSRHMQNLVIGVVAVAAVAGGAYFFLGGANDTAATQPPKQQTTQSSSANKPAPAAQPEKKKFDDVKDWEIDKIADAMVKGKGNSDETKKRLRKSNIRDNESLNFVAKYMGEINSIVLDRMQHSGNHV